MNPVSHPAEIPSNIDIASIVSRVLRELEAMNTKSEVDDGITIDQRLITLEDLKNVPASAKRIVVPTAAVVTPSAKDELKRRGITMLRSKANPPIAASTKPSKAVRDRSPFRRVHLLHDETIDSGVFAAVSKQVTARGIRLCDQATVTVTLSTRPATVVYRSIAAHTSAVSINRIDDILRFKHELRPTVYILDALHLPLIAMVNAVVQIARRHETSTQVRPTITVAGGQR